MIWTDKIFVKWGVLSLREKKEHQLELKYPGVALGVYPYTHGPSPISSSFQSHQRGLSFSIRWCTSHSVPCLTGPFLCPPASCPHFPSPLPPHLHSSELILAIASSLTWPPSVFPRHPLSDSTLELRFYLFMVLHWSFLRAESVPHSVCISRTKHCAWHEKKIHKDV